MEKLIIAKAKGSRKLIIILSTILGIGFINGFTGNIPKGTSRESSLYKASNIEFLYDLTYLKDNKKIYEQIIFKEQLKMIENAEDFIILDMFLFNDEYNRKYEFPSIVEEFTEALINKKKEKPDIKILFITDEINNFYGVYKSPYITKLEENHIDVVITDLEKMRNSNPIYSGMWKTVIKWFGVKGKGWLPNPFSPDSPKVTMRGYLKLLNFKANHRKVLITEKGGIITSANIHDASGYHSNIGFKVSGDIINELIKSELAVAKFSGYEKDDFEYNNVYLEKEEESDAYVKLITESKIRDNLIKAINNTDKGDKISIGMFYLSHRGIINSLVDAANRGVDVKLILDPNKDAFGLKKNGIPNRQVAQELIRKSKDRIKIKWYDTHGEQYHSKLIFIENQNKSIIIGGSSNLTRRNIDNYNLEADLFIETKSNSKLSNEIKDYFNRIWNNKDGHYTVNYETYKTESLMKTIIYRIQEATGLSTF